MKRLNIGIDVSKDTLDMAYWEHNQSKAVYKGKFPNAQKGFHDIVKVVENICQETESTTVLVVMEPTGGYEQPLARFAIQKQWQVSLPNPYRVKL